MFVFMLLNSVANSNVLYEYREEAKKAVEKSWMAPQKWWDLMRHKRFGWG